MTHIVRPMLAATFEEARTVKHLAQDGYLLVQPKIDGMRVLIDNGLPRSRSWKVWTNSGLQAFAASNPEHMHGWDGEILPGIIEETPTAEAFRQAMSGVRSADGSKTFTYYLFDNFDPSWARFTYEHRLIGIRNDLIGPEYKDLHTHDLDTVILESGGDDAYRMFHGEGFQVLVKLCPTYKVYTLEMLYALEQKFLDQGFEGAIIRRKGRGYKYNRSTALEGALTKLKRFVSFEAVITGVYPRQHNANVATVSDLGYTVRSAHKDNKVDMECLGGFHCYLYGHPEVEFDVGVFKDLDMDTKEALWRVRETLPGKIIECVEQGYKGGYDKPRTPIFHRFRDPLEL